MISVLQIPLSILFSEFSVTLYCPGAVSYTHLDVYKRQDIKEGGTGRLFDEHNHQNLWNYILQYSKTI